MDYNQRNRYELQCAQKIAQLAQVEHRIIRCDLGVWGGSALTDLSWNVDNYSRKQVNTYVPARNSVLLALTLSWAEAIQAQDIFFAANADDYDNYPDCRPEFFAAFAQTAALATRVGCEGNLLKIHTPLLQWNKVQIIREGQRLNVDLAQTFSCYDPVNENVSCNNCLACEIRNQGFAMASLT